MGNKTKLKQFEDTCQKLGFDLEEVLLTDGFVDRAYIIANGRKYESVWIAEESKYTVRRIEN